MLLKQIIKQGITSTFKGVAINVGGKAITVNGTVIDGIVKIGTAYIP